MSSSIETIIYIIRYLFLFFVIIEYMFPHLCELEKIRSYPTFYESHLTLVPQMFPPIISSILQLFQTAKKRFCPEAIQIRSALDVAKGCLNIDGYPVFG